MKKLISIVVLIFFCSKMFGDFKIVNNSPLFTLGDQVIVCSPKEGLWSVSTGWQDNWMTGLKHASPDSYTKNGDWNVLTGKMVFKQGELFLRDSYKEIKPGLVKGIRHYEWKGKEVLPHVTLSVRWNMVGDNLEAFLPGILYYGNKNGAKVNKDVIPVYEGKPGEFAIFEDHRFPMPFAMLENRKKLYAAAVHTVPSPVRGALLNDQWWSLGVEAKNEGSEFVLYSGPIGYNREYSVAKALQSKPMRYTDTYLNLEPGRIIEKEFYIELYNIDREGTGFERPIYTSLDIYKPYDTEKLTSFEEIIEGKYRFAKERWIEMDKDVVGFNMYDTNLRKDIVMGWCGQADSPGYSLQVLSNMLKDNTLTDKVQRSMDFLSSTPINPETGLFQVGYNGKGERHGGDPVSCGQAMYNFAKAIETARKNKKYQIEKWEKFLKSACDGVSMRLLNENWNPHSTAEAFYIAPLAIASKLFKNETYRRAAEKASALYSERHLKMDGCYWGGTLDATCEDKEGAWAAFQGFLEMYERFNDKKYLDWSKHAMDVCLSYVVVWDIPLPAGRMADHNFKTTGWTVVSPQNQHIDVYGVLFAPEIYKMGKYLKDERLCRLSKVMYRSCYQLTDIYGSQGEQLQQTNFAQHGDMSNVYKLRGGYSESWTVFWITAHFLNAAARFKELNVEF